MNTNTIIGIIVVAAIIIVGGYFLFTADSTDVETDIDDAGVVSETPAPDDTGEGVDETQVVDDTQNGNGDTGDGSEAGDSTAPASENDSGGSTITYTNTGFSPSTITISQGETVTWVNNSGGSMLVASAFHPTHTVYPGSDIQKCGTAQETGIFDACKGIASGQSWTFIFNSAGEWGYHDHLNVSKFGKVIVQ